jgi:hypothetical protein
MTGLAPAAMPHVAIPTIILRDPSEVLEAISFFAFARILSNSANDFICFSSKYFLFVYKILTISYLFWLLTLAVNFGC